MQAMQACIYNPNSQLYHSSITHYNRIFRQGRPSVHLQPLGVGFGVVVVDGVAETVVLVPRVEVHVRQETAKIICFVRSNDGTLSAFYTAYRASRARKAFARPR